MNFKTFLLLIIILVSGVFIYLKTQSLGPDTSTFNQTTRYDLAKYPWVRQLLSLHKDGDARGEILGKTTGSITIEVVQPPGEKLSDATINDFAKKVSDVTGKPTQVFNVDTIQNGALSDYDFSQIVDKFRRHVSPGQANIFVIYADDFTTTTLEVGRTYKEFGILISHNRLAELTKQFPSVIDQYQESTLLHEFGHQIGLDHNDQTDCIMNPDVEMPQSALSFSGPSSPTDFCQTELDQIAAIKANFQ